MKWHDRHYPEWAETEAIGAEAWVGKVKRRKTAPANPMSMDETVETLWTSDSCSSEEEALRRARERIERGAPWDS
jgi:hypothetical protein